MGRKQKNQKTQRQNDSQVRMNFLFQAAHVIPQAHEISRGLIDTMRQTSTRSVSSMNPSIKKEFCKRCSSLLIPGITCKQRIRSKRQKHVVITCNSCGNIKRYNITPRKPAKTEINPSAFKKKRNKKRNKKSSTTAQTPALHTASTTTEQATSPRVSITKSPEPNALQNQQQSEPSTNRD